jgi:hypothetical protein
MVQTYRGFLAVLTAGLCQTFQVTNGANWDACYCTIEHARGALSNVWTHLLHESTNCVITWGEIENGCWICQAVGSNVIKEFKHIDGMCEPKSLCDFDECRTMANVDTYM